MNAGVGAGAWLAAVLVVSCLPVVEGAGDDVGPDGAAGGAPPGVLGDGVGVGAFRYRTDACQAAAEVACGQELADCAARGGCSAYFSCWFGCEPTDLDCRARCAEGPVTSEEMALRHCVARSALDACGTESMLLDRRGPTCAACAEQRCSRQLDACLATEGCARRLACEGTNPSPGPSQCELAIPEDTLTDAALSYDALLDDCLRPPREVGCRADCSEAWGCVGDFEYPIDPNYGVVFGTIITGDGGGVELEPDPATYIELIVSVFGNAAPNTILWDSTPFELRACRGDDLLCELPRAVVTTSSGFPVRLDRLLLSSEVGFDGILLVDGPSVFPGRLQGMLPHFPGVPGEKQRIVVLPSDTLERGVATVPDFDPEALFIAGSIGDCSNALASGVTMSASSGRLYYLDESGLPVTTATETTDAGQFIVVDLQPGTVTLTARYGGETVSQMQALMMAGRYTGVHLTPLPRSAR